MYLPRSRAGITSATADCDSTMRPPPPMPWITRVRMSIPMDVDRAPMTERCHEHRDHETDEDQDHCLLGWCVGGRVSGGVRHALSVTASRKTAIASAREG